MTSTEDHRIRPAPQAPPPTGSAPPALDDPPGRTNPLVFGSRARWALASAATVVGVVIVGLSFAVGDSKDEYVLIHALAALPFLGTGLGCTWRTIGAAPPEYRTFWRRWFVASIASTLAASAAAVGIATGQRAFLVLDMVFFLAGVPLWTSATLLMVRAQAGRRSMSVDLVDAAMALAVLGAPGALLAAEQLADIGEGGDSLFAIPFTLAAVLTPACVYLTILNLARVPKGDRAAHGIGTALAATFTVSLTLQLAHALGDLDWPLPVFVGFHVATMGLLMAVPLWAHRQPAAALARLPAERQVRRSNPMPYVSAALLPVLAVYVVATRAERPGGMTFLLVVLLLVVMLNAVRYTVMNREARRLYAGIARLSEERRRLLTSVLRALEADRHRTAAELHTQAVGSLASLGSMIQTAYIALPADTAAAVRETLAELQGDLSARAEQLRQLMVAMRPASFVEGRTGLPATNDDALAAALLAYASELVPEGSAQTVRVWVDPTLELDWSTMTIVYRIAQEALLNAARHAGATTVDVSVAEHPRGILLEVRDDGAGFDPVRVARGSGLAAIELFTQLGRGELTVRSAAGEGTVVRSLLGVRVASGRPRRRLHMIQSPPD